MRNFLEKLKKHKRDILLLFILFLLTAYVFRGWFSSGIIAKGDFHSWSKTALKEFVGPPSAWEIYEGGGYYSLRNGFQIIRYPSLLIRGLIAKIFDIGFSAVERITIFFPFIALSIIGMYRLSDYIFKNKIINFFAALAYLLNPLTVVFAYVSHFATMIFVYCLCPFILLFYIKALDEQTFRKRAQYSLLSAMTFSLALYSDLKIPYVIFGAIIGLFIFYFAWDLFYFKQKACENLSKRSIALTIMLGAIILLNLFWLIPLAFAPPIQEIAKIAHYFNVDIIDKSFPLHYGLVPCSLRFEMNIPFLFLMAVVAFCFIFFLKNTPKKQKRLLIFFLIWYLFAAFLRKEGAPPFPEIFVWLFKNVPGFFAFRDTNKILFASALPWSLMFGFSVFNLNNFLAQKLNLKSKKSNVSNYVFFAGIILILLANLSWLLFAYPLAKSTNNDNIKYFSTLKPEPVSQENLLMEKFFSKDPDKFRILYLPTDPAFGVLNKKHTAIYTADLNPAGSPFIDYLLAWRWYVKGPFFKDQIKNLGKLLSLKNIKYVVYLPKNDIYFQSIGAEKERQNAEKLLVLTEKQKDLTKIDLGKNLNVFLNESLAPNSSIFFTNQAFLINAGYNSLLPLAELPLDFNKNVFFSVYHLKEKILSQEIGIKNIVHFKKDTKDLMLSSLPKEYFIDLWPYAQEMSFNDEKIQSKKRFQREYVKYPCLTNIEGEIPLSPQGLIKGKGSFLTLPLKTKSPGTYEVWLRLGLVDTYDGAKDIDLANVSSLLSISINNQKITYDKFQLKYSKNLEWVKLFDFNFKNKENYLRIDWWDQNRYLVLDVLALVPQKEISKHRKEVETFLEGKTILTISPGNPEEKDWEKTQENSKVPVLVKEINSSDYEISFEAKEPGFLVFRDNYDSYWNLTLNNEEYKPIMTLGENNSFYMPEPNVYDGTLKFEPQKYMDVGFVLTIINWLAIIIIVLRLNRKCLS